MSALRRNLMPLALLLCPVQGLAGPSVALPIQAALGEPVTLRELDRAAGRILVSARRAEASGEEDEDLAFELERVAQIYAERKLLDKAIPLMVQATAMFPGPPSAFRMSQRRYFQARLARLYTLKGNHRAAFEIYWGNARSQLQFRDPFMGDDTNYLTSAAESLEALGRLTERMVIVRNVTAIATKEVNERTRKPVNEGGTRPTAPSVRPAVLRESFDSLIESAWQLSKRSPPVDNRELVEIADLLTGNPALAASRTCARFTEPASAATGLLDSENHRLVLILIATLESGDPARRQQASELAAALYDKLAAQSWRGDPMLFAAGQLASRLALETDRAQRSVQIQNTIERNWLELSGSATDPSRRLPLLGSRPLAATIREVCGR